MEASAMGAITRIAVRSNLHITKSGIPTKLAEAAAEKSRIALPSAFVIPMAFIANARP